MAETYKHSAVTHESAHDERQEPAAVTPLRLGKRALDSYGVTDHPATFYPVETSFPEIAQMEIDTALAPFRQNATPKWVAVALFLQQRCNNQLANGDPKEQIVADLRQAADPLYDMMLNDR